MSRYLKGARFERRVKKYLEEKGYLVIRAAGSKPFDLVGIKNGKAIVLECKVSEGILKKTELERLIMMVTEVKATPIIAFGRKGSIILINAVTNKDFIP
tara:strand:- start:297 stop:593 length:297 start_codon:yes stop_codon:yes gene_type:complete